MTLSKQRKQEIAAMPKIPCACGCGTMIAPINKKGEPAKYAHGHNGNTPPPLKPGYVVWNKGKPNPSASIIHKGKKLPNEEIERRTATRLIHNGGVYQRKRGWKHTPETIERMKTVNRAKALHGEHNPFYGKHHTERAKQIISEKKSGERNPNWHNGAATLPYGPEFTRKFKRLIRERDNYTCQRCGKTQAENGCTMQVHHIDHNKMNNDPTNLVTVCNSCNVWLSYHRDEPFTPIK